MPSIRHAQGREVSLVKKLWKAKCRLECMETHKKCAHPSCRCSAKEDSDYCSTYCEGEAKTADIICSCGHGNCRDASK